MKIWETMVINSQGSWFPSGYHGHFRSKPRSDFVNSYRQEARPSPPNKFVKRIQDRPTHHHFSNHDNRFSFLNTVTSFQDGLGKKKVENRWSGRFKPDFIAWIPHKKEIQSAGPHVSIYRDTFHPAGEGSMQHVLVESVRSRSAPTQRTRSATVSAPYIDQDFYDNSPLESSYRFSHGHLQPNPLVTTNMNTGTVTDEEVPPQKTNTFLNPRTKSIYDNPRRLTRRSRVASAPSLRMGVASCLVWCDFNSQQTHVDDLPDKIGSRKRTSMMVNETNDEIDVRPQTAMASLPSINPEERRGESSQITTQPLFMPRPPSPVGNTALDTSPSIIAE